MRMLDIIAHVQAWCSTGYIYEGYNWGTCGPDCAWHEDTISWRKDETVKMTLQYYNHALWVGLEVYGSILLWIFPLGLILTTILPITGKLIVTVCQKCSQYSILVIKIAEFEKSELSILLADKMDEMDRTWEWFKDRYQNRYFRICIRKVIDLSERLNGKFKILIRISCKVAYNVVIAILAYTLTRDGGDYYEEFNMFGHALHMEPTFFYKITWAYIVFLILLI